MVVVIVIVMIVLFSIVYFLAQDSTKNTTKERYGDAVSKLAYMTANGVSDIARGITESSTDKEKRLAFESLGRWHASLYRYEHYWNKNGIKRLFEIDDNFRKTLKTLGLSDEAWTQIAQKIFYIGCIKINSREVYDYSKRNSEGVRKYLLNEALEEWKQPESLASSVSVLREGLSYFHIPEEEWVKYGDVVLDMHNIYEQKDLKEFGVIGSILPMQNNMHLL